MKKVGILYDNISGNTGDVAIGLSLKQILRQLNVAFDELVPGLFNPLEYETIIVGGGHLLRPSPDFFYDKFRVPGNHVLNAMGIVAEPQDLDYLNNYHYITVRSNGDKKKLAYLKKEVHVIPCTSILLEDLPDFFHTLKNPCIGIHIFPVFSSLEEEEAFVRYVSSLPFTIYFLPVTHYNRDIDYMRQLQAKIPNAELLPILKAQEIFTLAGRFDYFISCSLHGAIFSYSHNVPFVLYNNSDKMQFFMEDRGLEQYLFKNFIEMKRAFEKVTRENPDYTEKYLKDRKVLNEYVGFLKTILPSGNGEPVPENEIIAQSTYQINSLLQEVSGFERKYHELTRNSQSLEKKLAARDQQIRSLEQGIRSLEQEIDSFKRSISYKVTNKFHRTLIERLFRPNSRRRRFYDRGLKEGRILVNEGPKKALVNRNYKKALRQFLEKISYNRHLWKTGIFPMNDNAGDFPYTGDQPGGNLVSIIIPTKNAGPGFEEVLQKITDQQGVPLAEIIVVDSGSTDKTVDIAKKYHCRVFPIQPEDFNHGLTRNYGAEQATGDFILFTVQDAIPQGTDWLSMILRAFRKYPDIATVSCRQVPPTDADLFAGYSMCSHYTFMEFHEDRIVKIDPAVFRTLSFPDKRKLAGIDDVCTCFRSEIFRRFKYRKLNFAEDLDIGLRLVENGYPLGFLYSASVIHSHTRGPEYFLQRCYADSKSIVEISGTVPEPDTSDPAKVIYAMYGAYTRVKVSLAHLKTRYPDTINTEQFFSALLEMLNSRQDTLEEGADETLVETMLSEFVLLSKPVPMDIQPVLTNFYTELDRFRDFAGNRGGTYNIDELAESTDKLFSSYCGSILGNLYCQHSTTYLMQSVDHLLSSRV